VNDVHQYDDAVETVPDNLLDIMQMLHAANSDVQIFLGTITPHTNDSYQDEIDAINAQIPGIVAEARALGIDAYLVSHAGVTEAMLEDSVHPGATGLRTMADAWYDALLTEADQTAGTFNGDVQSVSTAVSHVTGSEAGDRLSGDSGANTIRGRDGNDYLNGRGGDDDLYGGGDRDTFLFEGDFGNDTIHDFNISTTEGDVIALRNVGVTRFSDLDIDNTSAGAVVSFSAGQSILVADVNASDLDDDHFVFV